MSRRSVPLPIGSEVAGVIEALGPGVDDLKVGDQVSTVNAFAISEYGTFGETTLIPARALSAYPQSIHISRGGRLWIRLYDLLALGADHIIATEEENLIERVMEITGGQPAVPVDRN